MYPSVLACSLALPLVQKALLVNWAFLYVGQVGHVHSLLFSSCLGLGYPKIFAISGFGFKLIMVFVLGSISYKKEPKRLRRDHSILLWVCIILSASILIPVPTYYEYITCPRCGSQVISNSNYCNFCGTALKPSQVVLKICPRCKNRIPEAARFCPECGQKQDCPNNKNHCNQGSHKV
jgi:RNA polymerase subunit RPABC4/transcription elongation factor Spt4